LLVPWWFVLFLLFSLTVRGAASPVYNAPTHISQKTTEFMTNNNMVSVPHPPNSLDLVPCDFALFPKLKMKLKGQRFETASDTQRESQVVLDRIRENDFHGDFEVWKK
jgi:hypothetical protein